MSYAGALWDKLDRTDEVLGVVGSTGTAVGAALTCLDDLTDRRR